MRLLGPHGYVRLTLWILTGWAMVLSLESLVRNPGALRAWKLPPEKMLLDGVPYEREPIDDHRLRTKTLPSSAQLVRRWLVTYRRDLGANRHAPARIRLAEIEATGSGRANRLPARRIREWMGNPSQSARCLLPGNGKEPRVVVLSPELVESTVNPPGNVTLRTTLWMLGLARNEDVRCLWVSSEDPLSPSLLRELALLMR